MEEPSVTKTQTNRVHGSILGSRFAFAEQRWGKPGKQTLVDRLPAKERSLFESAIFENHWFDFNILELIDRAIVERLASGDEAVLKDLGRFSAEYNYKRLPPQLINQPPEEVFKNASRINVIFQDCGELQYQEMKSNDEIKRGAIIYRYDQAVPDSYCISALGYFERLLELLGYRVLGVDETECQSRGNDVHRYEISWEAERVAEPVMPQRGQTGKLTVPAGAASTVTSSMRVPANSSEKQPDGRTRELSMRSVTAKKKPSPWTHWRVKALLALIAITSLIGIVQAIYSLATRKRAPVTAVEIIHKYSCNGAMQPKLQLDRPFFIINTPDPLENVNFAIEDNNKKYILTVPKIISNARIEFGLEQFLSKDRKALSGKIVPRNITITTTVNGKPKECSCWLDD